MAESKRDYYEVLGVGRDADEATLKKAYRQIAKKYHPDMNPGDAEAEKKFKEASEAYAVLSDPDKRRQYDQFGHAAFEGGAGGAGGFGGFDFSGADFSDIFGDIFGDLFGGGRRGRANQGPMKGMNIRKSVRLTFEEAVFGCEKELDVVLKDPCPKCHGTGAKPGTSPETCPKCGGKGQVVYTQQSFFGTVQNVQTCPDCHGTGKIIRDKCPDCGGTGYVSSRKKISVSIPAGIDNGQSVRIRGKGRAGRKRRSQGRPAGRSDCVQTPDLPAAGCAHLFYCADFFCTGSTGRRYQDQDSGRRSALQCEAGNQDRYQSAFEGQGCTVYTECTGQRRSLCYIGDPDAGAFERRSKRSAAPI